MCQFTCTLQILSNSFSPKISLTTFLHSHECPLPSQFVNDADWHLTLIPHLLGSHRSNWTSSLQMSQIWHFLQLDDLWPLYVTFDLMNICRFPCNVHKPSLIPLGLQLFKWDHLYIFSPPITIHPLQMSQIQHFQAILKLDLRRPSTLIICVLWPHELISFPILYP